MFDATNKKEGVSKLAHPLFYIERYITNSPASARKQPSKPLFIELL